MLISVIAAIDAKNGLGYKNQLLCHLPADLKHFKDTTINKPIIMGRNTFLSIGKPLPHRLNIVLTSQKMYGEGIHIFDTLEKALTFVEDYPEVMIIGGEKLYETALSMAHRLYITKIHAQLKADVFFPIINQKDWRCVNERFKARDSVNLYDLSFCIYERI